MTKLRLLPSRIRVSCPQRPPYLPLTSRICSSTTSSTTSRYHSSQTSPGSSVSEAEVSHFSSLASTWWDPYGPSRLLHLMNPFRHDFIRGCVHSSPDAISADQRYSYLDIGCGGGIFSSSAARLRSTTSVTAIDPSPAVIAVAKAHQRCDPSISEPKLRFLNCAIEDLSNTALENNTQAAEPNLFNILTVFEVLEHVASPSQFLSLAARHLRIGGWLVGSTISRSLLSYLTTKVIAEAPLVGVVPSGTHDWNKYINPLELARWFETDQTGVKWGPMKTQGVIYLPAMGWKMVSGSERFGNYFFGVQKLG